MPRYEIPFYIPVTDSHRYSAFVEAGSPEEAAQLFEDACEKGEMPFSLSEPKVIPGDYDWQEAQRTEEPIQEDV